MIALSLESFLSGRERAIRFVTHRFYEIQENKELHIDAVYYDPLKNLLVFVVSKNSEGVSKNPALISRIGIPGEFIQSNDTDAIADIVKGFVFKGSVEL